MPLNKSKGNMYEFVTHTHASLGGECSHRCVYCFVDNPRFGRPEKYTGPLRLIEKELEVKYGSGKTIFMENCNDLFAADVSEIFIHRIIMHAIAWPQNTYVWQTKNPARFLSTGILSFPANSLFGTTIETNRDIPEVGHAPSPEKRMLAMVELKARKFVTVEPILNCDVEILADWIIRIKPEFVNIGADSKGHRLNEPTGEKVLALIEEIKGAGIELREKHNLARLIGGAKS